MEEKFPDATNFQYVNRGDISMEKKIFMNNVNSYHGSSLVKTILNQNEENLVEEKMTYKICGTRQMDAEVLDTFGIEILSPGSISFFDSIIACDVIIYDISQDFSQLSEAKRFLEFLEIQLEDGKIENVKYLILLSTIMTWSQTPQQEDSSTDLNYRKRRPHPCFVNHLIMERDFINLQKKFKNLVKSLVVCPGIIYGGRQDIFHFLYKKCYFNNLQLDIFAPANNHLPLIYLEDFTRILMMIIQEYPEPKCDYILAVQPETLSAKTVVKMFAEAAGGPLMRIKICPQDEIFVMKEELMTQRVFKHLTLNLRVESEFLKSFDFTFTGLNMAMNSEKLSREFHTSRNLKPIKFLIEGSPFAYQNELAEMLARFYSLHRIQPECFLENFCQRLKRSLKKCEEYAVQMNLMKSNNKPTKMYEELIEKTSGQIIIWQEKLQTICELLEGHEMNPQFNEIQEFLIERLSSFGCWKNQGYVMSGFELDSEMASSLFLVPTDSEFEFNEETKPDFVIVMNRMMDQVDCMSMERNISAKGDESSSDNEMKADLQRYYDSHCEDVSLLNFFLDREIIPIEFNFDRDMTKEELQDIFETIKSKVGPPKNYGLSKKEQEEIFRLKQEIKRQEAAEKAEADQKKAQQELQEKEKQIQEWTNAMMQRKREEIAAMEKHCLPTRHYLVKYILPNITDALTEIATLRPKKPVEYLAQLLLNQKNEKVDDDELDEEIVSEFQKLVASKNCEN